MGSSAETLAAGTVGGGIRVGDLEAAFLEVVAEIEHRAADEERALGIDDHADARGFHQDVPVRRAIDEVHLVLKPGTTAADDRDAQRALRPALPGQERIQLGGGGRRDFDELLAADPELDFALWRRGIDHECTLRAGGWRSRRARFRHKPGILTERPSSSVLYASLTK